MLTNMNGKYGNAGEIIIFPMGGSTTSGTVWEKYCQKNLEQQEWLLLRSGRKRKINARFSVTARESNGLHFPDQISWRVPLR